MRILYLFSLCTALILSGGCAPTQENASDDTFLHEILSHYPELKNKSYEIKTIERVIDGDTFVTESGEKIRLIGVNTPEISGQGEYYGQEASNFSQSQLLGQVVYLFHDVSETDRYQRWLRYLFIQGQTEMFNETLIREGYANTMTVPPDVMFAQTFTELERQSKLEGKGLWGEVQPSSNQVYEASCDQPEIKGNINSNNEKIYHLPGGSYYDQTIAEEMFCTEEEAIEAGYRASKR